MSASATATIASHEASFDADRQRAIARKAIARQSFCTLATSSSSNVPHVVGVRYAVVDGALYVTMFDDSIKVRNIRDNPRVAVCIPARKIPMFPAFAVQFQGWAGLLPNDDPEIVRLYEAGAFKRIISKADFENPHSCFARIAPPRRVSTYGLGVPLLQIVRDPERGPVNAATREMRDTPAGLTAWAALARLLMVAVFAQSIFAGVFLSGEGWGRTAHRLTAYGLVAITLTAGIVAVVTLAPSKGGRRFAFGLVAFGAGLAVQMVIGMLSADGERLLWLHIPFGVALVGTAAGLEGAVRRLDR